MNFIRKIVKVLPKPIKKLLSYPLSFLGLKNYIELSFWQSRFKSDNNLFVNSHYEDLMLAMADEPDDSFLSGKIVADFGCGPRGSLVWAVSAKMRIGVDILADQYFENFKANMVNHSMIYLKSTEKVIPLPTGFVDVVFSLNSLDHVNDFSTICSEIVRVLKPGGEFIGSFNINQPASVCEPQKLDEKIIKDNLLVFFNIYQYRLSDLGPAYNCYEPLMKNEFTHDSENEGILWVRATKK